jgi:hypothetical protein
MTIVVTNQEDTENVNEWIRYGLKIAVQSALHPFEYSKVLIQVKCCINFFFLINLMKKNHLFA